MSRAEAVTADEIVLRTMTAADFAGVAALNQSEVPKVTPIDEAELAALVGVCELALVAERAGRLAGFVLVLGPGVAYRSMNYQFFERRGGAFVYVDRIAVAAEHRRAGVAAALYDAVAEHARSTGRVEIACEVNVRPPNPPSLAFHLGREFVEVGRQDVAEGRYRVAYLVCRLGDDVDGHPSDPSRSGIEDAELPDNPIRLLRSWLDAAINAELAEPTAFALATAGADGDPDARMVLLRGVTPLGVRFFTNRRSAKGRQLAERPRATGVLYWPELNRQVRITGDVKLLSDVDSDAYFAARPRDAQLGAWASEQSTPVADRSTLEDQVTAVAERFADGPVPRPEHWGGYLLVAERIEFWQGRQARLHDRIRYRHDGQAWLRERLQP